MYQLRLGDVVRFSGFCKKLIEFDSNIALVAIINKKGRILELQAKECLSSQLDGKDLEMLFMQRTLQTTMIKESDAKFGIFNYTLTKREKYYEYTTQFEDGMMLVMIDSILSLTSIIPIIDKINQKSFLDFKLLPAISA
ncbi:MAG: hypothetical protein ACT4NT_01190 [Nitrososphaerota archaeon]